MGPGINSFLSKDFFHLSPDPMAVVDEGGRIRKTNPAFGRLAGHEERDMLLQPVCAFLPVGDETCMDLRFRKARQSGQSLTFESSFTSFPQKSSGSSGALFLSPGKIFFTSAVGTSPS